MDAASIFFFAAAIFGIAAFSTALANRIDLGMRVFFPCGCVSFALGVVVECVMLAVGG